MNRSKIIQIIEFERKLIKCLMFNTIIQSEKILLLPLKYEIIMVPSNHSVLQYCDSNIGLFSIAPCKVITHNPFCILFGTSSLLLFGWLSL